MSNEALLIIDVQNDFLPGGALETENGKSIIKEINEIQNKFTHIIATQDWHPRDHKSFASNNTNSKAGDVIDLNGVEQILWPNHCIENTKGSEFAKELNTTNITKIIKKGNNKEVDSYSGFYENDKKTKTQLDNYLKSMNINSLYVCGIATDYCVKYTVLDALNLGYKVHLLTDSCSAVNLSDNDSDTAILEMKNNGAKIL